MKNICISKRTGRQFLSCLEYRRNQNLTLCNCFSGAPAKIVICFLEVCYYGCYQFVALNFNESMLMVHSPPICYQLVTSNLQAMLLKFSINVLHYCLCSLCGPEEYTLYAKPKMYCQLNQSCNSLIKYFQFSYNEANTESSHYIQLNLMHTFFFYLFL